MEDELIEKIGRMNSAAIRSSLSGMEQKLAEMQELIRGQQNTIGTCMSRINNLEQQLLVIKVRTTGSGPST